MPRRKADTRQGTLSFGNQGRVSKPFAHPSAPPGKGVTQEISLPSHPVPPATVDLPPSTTSTALVQEQTKAEIAAPKSKEDLRAESLPRRAIEQYWETLQAQRAAPRVHQAHLSMEERILRHFDLCNAYGPCIGIARLRRWRRAHGLGLQPPIEVLAVLLQADAGQGEKAYIDELLA